MESELYEFISMCSGCLLLQGAIELDEEGLQQFFFIALGEEVPILKSEVLDNGTICRLCSVEGQVPVKVESQFPGAF